MTINKTELTNLFLTGIVESIFKENDKHLNVENKGVVTSVSAYETINPYFYCFSKDQTAHGFYAMEDEEQSDYIEKVFQGMQQTMCLCEISDIEPLASKDIEGGNFKGTLTFFIANDKIVYLDSYVDYLRTLYNGKYETLKQASKDMTLILKFGSLVVQSDPFMSNIGMANVCTLEIDFGYLDKAPNYTEEQISVSLDGTTYTEFPFNQATISVAYTTQANTQMANPKAIGEFQESVSLTMTFSFYEFTRFSYFKSLRNKCLGACSLSNSNYSLNNFIWVKYNGMTFKMIVKSWANTIVNTDISNCQMGLALAI